eukprot:s2837_g10.t1
MELWGPLCMRKCSAQQDICHSYAKARYMQTGKWTGPLSDGIAKALDYGAWGGGDVEAPLAGSRQSFIPVLAPWEHREVT